MRKSFALPFAFLAAIALPAVAQMDTQAMQKWSRAKVIYYTVEGVHTGAASVTISQGGLGDVTDRVTMNLEWSLSGGLLNVTALKNYPSEVKNLRDREPSCLPPVLNGPLELATVQEVTNGLGGAIDLKIERSYPAAGVAQFCTASRKAVPAAKKVVMESMAVPSPVLLAMGAPASDTLSYSADKKSLIYKKGDGWTWTFTPSVTRPSK